VRCCLTTWWLQSSTRFLTCFGHSTTAATKPSKHPVSQKASNQLGPTWTTLLLS